MDATLLQSSLHLTDKERAALDTDQLDRWQAVLPEPFAFLDSLLHEIIDDVLLTATITEHANADTKPKPDSEEDAALIGSPGARELPAALAGMGADSIMCPIAEGVYAVALSSGGLWLWDAGGGSEPQQLSVGEAAVSLVQCELQCTPLSPASAPPARRRLMLLAATPTPPPAEGGEAAPAEAGADAQLLVLDLASPSVHNLKKAPAWEVAPVADVRLPALAPHATATLATDGRFAACVRHDGRLAVYYLPLPKPAPLAVADESKAGAEGTAPAAVPAAPAALVLTTEALVPPGGALCVHFVLAPAPRSVGEPLTWGACGLMLWAEGSRTNHQRMLPPRSELDRPGGAAAAAEAAAALVAAAPDDRIEWMLPGVLTASTVSTDSVLLATGLDEGSVILWDTNVRASPALAPPPYRVTPRPTAPCATMSPDRAPTLAARRVR
jgi:hypothetical protein